MRVVQFARLDTVCQDEEDEEEEEEIYSTNSQKSVP
jgi:hypothetical protein